LIHLSNADGDKYSSRLPVEFRRNFSTRPVHTAFDEFSVGTSSHQPSALTLKT
jgi:hypothetical protein